MKLPIPLAVQSMRDTLGEECMERSAMALFAMNLACVKAATKLGITGASCDNMELQYIVT